MARASEKTCPNLHRLFDEAPKSLIDQFVRSKSFERMKWLERYGTTSLDDESVSPVKEMLRKEKKSSLDPLESEAARIHVIANTRGQFALEGLATLKLAPGRVRELMSNQDSIARSLWAYLYEHALFEAVENSLHLHLYRRYDKHYQTFLLESNSDADPGTQTGDINALLKDIAERLDRGDGYDVDRFDMPAEGEEPAAQMYVIYHPERHTSVREIDENGIRTRLYLRPPGEAMVVYTPSTGRVHVRAGTRSLRHAVAHSFVEQLLGQSLSSQPIDFQAYDISRFFDGLELELPEVEDAIILRAQVIRVELSVGNLANRLSLATTIDQDISMIIQEQPGLERIFKRALAIRFLEIAVRYRRVGKATDETLDFTLTDRNTSSLMSLDDPFERNLGHRLLRAWGMLRDGRKASAAEGMAALPALIALWDEARTEVTGNWLTARRVDAKLLQDIGFLVPAGWEGDDLIDDEDTVGQTSVKPVVAKEGIDLETSPGQTSPGLSHDAYRRFRVRDDWVAKYLRDRLADLLDATHVEELTPHLVALGTLRFDDRDVPLYLARRLDDERVHDRVDTELRARADAGTGLVLQAGQVAGKCLVANVLTPLADHLTGTLPDVEWNVESLREVYRRNRGLARGGETVRLDLSGDNVGTLFVPEKPALRIIGENRLLVVARLVNANNSSLGPMKTEDLIAGMEGQSLQNILSKPLWDKLKSEYIRSPKKGLWEIAV